MILNHQSVRNPYDLDYTINKICVLAVPQLRKTSGPQPKQNGKTSPPPINQVQLRPTPKEVPIKINGDDSVDEKPNFLAQKTLLKKPKERIIKPTLRAERPMTRTRTFDVRLPDLNFTTLTTHT